MDRLYTKIFVVVVAAVHSTLATTNSTVELKSGVYIFMIILLVGLAIALAVVVAFLITIYARSRAKVKRNSTKSTSKTTSGQTAPSSKYNSKSKPTKVVSKNFKMPHETSAKIAAKANQKTKTKQLKLPTGAIKKSRSRKQKTKSGSSGRPTKSLKSEAAVSTAKSIGTSSNVSKETTLPCVSLNSTADKLDTTVLDKHRPIRKAGYMDPRGIDFVKGLVKEADEHIDCLKIGIDRVKKEVALESKIAPQFNRKLKPAMRWSLPRTKAPSNTEVDVENQVFQDSSGVARRSSQGVIHRLMDRVTHWRAQPKPKSQRTSFFSKLRRGSVGDSASTVSESTTISDIQTVKTGSLGTENGTKCTPRNGTIIKYPSGRDEKLQLLEKDVGVKNSENVTISDGIKFETGRLNDEIPAAHILATGAIGRGQRDIAGTDRTIHDSFISSKQTFNTLSTDLSKTDSEKSTEPSGSIGLKTIQDMKEPSPQLHAAKPEDAELDTLLTPNRGKL